MRAELFALTLATPAFLSACAAPARSVALPEPMSTRTITWVMASSPNEPCNELIRAKGLWAKQGCADFRDKDNCVIYAKPPADEADRQSMFRLGHEVLHCFAGDFH